MSIHRQCLKTFLHQYERCISTRYISKPLKHSFGINFRNYATRTLHPERKKRNFYYPCLSPNELKVVKNVTGLHVGLNDLSWVTVEVDDYDISQMGTAKFPDNFEKMTLDELSAFAFQSFEMIPKTNLYIMEEFPKFSSFNGGRQHLFLQSSRLQYVAMLVGMMNITVGDEKRHRDSAVFLKHRLSSKLFGILIGKEIVSSIKVVNEVLSRQISSRFTPLKCSSMIKSLYNQHNRIEQETIGQALLLAITFLELGVYQNAKCQEFLSLGSVIQEVKNLG